MSNLPSPSEAADTHEALMQFLYRAPVGLVQATPDGTIEMMNPMSASLLLPLSDGHLENLFVALAEIVPQLRQMTQDFKLSSGSICESMRLRLPGSVYARAPQWLSLSLMKLDSIRLMALITDVTFDVQREHSDLARQRAAAARRDTLTGLPNRVVACEMIDVAIAQGSQPGCDEAVFYINCDRFESINETLGHAAGDEVLRALAERLTFSLRRTNRGGAAPGYEPLAARIGGDEFVVIMRDLVYPDDAHAVAQRLLSSVTRSYGIDAREIPCSVSMGVVLRAHLRGTADSVLQDARIAMLEAKRSGGGRYVVFEPVMQERASHRHAVESELRRAIVEQELFVVYQPVVGLQGEPSSRQRTAGVEALVRWRHPARGTVPPGEFIGIAEECGLIGLLGDFVLSTACRQFVRWQTELGALAPRLLAVNLSRSQLGEPGFVASVEHILRQTRMEPFRLQLEVTESLAAQDEAIRDSLQELKSLGITLALDDFGTGYSSLSSLHQLPVDTIKIDRSFVDEAVTSAHHRVLIEATVRVARSLKMVTVAEGIETREQAAVVRRLGCEKGQGYFYGKPMLASDLERWVVAYEVPA